MPVRTLTMPIPDEVSPDPLKYAGATPLPPGRQVAPLADLPEGMRLAIAEEALAPSAPGQWLEVGGSFRPLALLPSRGWYEWHWLRGIDPERFRRAKIPAGVREAVYRRDGYRCVTCGTGDRLSLDHIFPWSLGGSDDYDNLQTMCQPCNSRKGARV